MFALMIALTCAAHMAAVPIANGGFEQGLAGWYVETGMAGQDGGGPNRVEVVGAGGAEGGHFARLEYRRTWLWMTTSSLPDEVRGLRLTVKLRAKRVSGAGELDAGFTEFPKGRHEWAQAHDMLFVGEIPTDGAWHEIYFPIDVPAYDTAARDIGLKLGCGHGRPSVLLLDDVGIVDAGPVPPAPAVAETGETEGHVPDEIPFFTAPHIPLLPRAAGAAHQTGHIGPLEADLPARIDPTQGRLTPLAVTLTNHGREAVAVRLRLYGPAGTEADDCALTLPAAGHRTATVALRTVQPLPHQVVLEVSAGGESLGFGIDVVPRRVFPLFGVVEHFDRTPPGPVRAARDVGLVHELPCSAYRIDCGWAYIEPEQGKPYRFESTDAYVDLVRSRGHCPVLMMLGYQPGWANPFDDPTDQAKLDAYRSAIRAIVKRYAGAVDYWEAWNEPDGFWFGGHDEEYLAKGPPMLLAVQKIVWDAVREFDPTGHVLTPGFVPDALHPGTTEWRVIEELYRLGFDRYFDALTVHVYPGWTPPSLATYTVDGKTARQTEHWRALDHAADMGELASLMARAGKPKPIWVTEFGGFDPADERSQALACLRTVAAMASARLESALYYELYDYPHDAHPPKLYLARSADLHRTLGFVAYQDAIRALTGASLAPTALRVTSPQGVEVRAFARPGERIALVWSNGATKQRVRIDWQGEVERVDLVRWDPSRSPMRSSRTAGPGQSVEIELQPLEFVLATARMKGWQKG